LYRGITKEVDISINIHRTASEVPDPRDQAGDYTALWSADERQIAVNAHASFNEEEYWNEEAEQAEIFCR
jgi:hypothetical protein